jgi:hypothetical protein
VEDDICFLPPYEQEDIVLMQAAGNQSMGWQVTAFNLPEIWMTTKGQDVKIAVLDTGVDLNHPDLQSCLMPGVNFVTPGYPPEDDNSHGTHIAGIIAAEYNDFGIVGIAPAAKIIPVKVLGRNGSGKMSDVVKGIYWAIENGADLISMSLGTRKPIEEVKTAISKALEAGVVVFTAAGNAGANNQLLYPAAYGETISIGAIDENSFRADFSCTGPNLDFVAPGVRIYSTVPKSSYSFLSGTSMAAPFAVATAALVLAHRRTVTPGVRLSADDYRNVFKENTLDVANLNTTLDATGKRFYQGFGIIRPDHFTEWVEIKKIQEIEAKIRRLIEDIKSVNDKKKLSIIKEKAELIQQVLRGEEAEPLVSALTVPVEPTPQTTVPLGVTISGPPSISAVILTSGPTISPPTNEPAKPSVPSKP